MKVENENLNSIYDLFALCCNQVMEDCNRGKFQIPPICDDEEYEAIEAIVSGYVCNREQEGKRQAFNMLLCDLVKVLGLNCTSEQTFKIAKSIDKKVSIEEPISEDEFSQFVTYSSLNQYLDNKVRIFPVLESTFISKTNKLYKIKSEKNYPLLRDSKPANSYIGNFFDNYIVMDKPGIENHPIKVVRAKVDGAFYKEFSNKNVLKIDLIPFTQVDIEEIGNIRCEGGYFWLEGIKEEQEKRLLNRLEKYFENSERGKVDFIVFPEMLFTRKLLNCSKEKAHSNEIVINGSIWQDNKNKCVVSLGESELLAHYKRCPFIYKKKYMVDNKEIIEEYRERLVPLDVNRKIYQILEIEGFGRVALGICRDLDYDLAQSLWKNMQINLLIIPAYTKSDDMVNSAQALASLNNMIVILNNACAAVSSEKEECPSDVKTNFPIGFVMFPGIKDGKRFPVVEYYYKNAACAACIDVCKGHRLVINLNKIVNTNERQAQTYEWQWE